MLTGRTLSRRDLQQLFKHLVQGGVLSEVDFWRGRQAQLQQRLQSGKSSSQRPGLSSVMLAHMQGSQDGRSNTVRSAPPSARRPRCQRQPRRARPRAQVTMKLTPELVQQIFAERPHVRRAHEALVPQSLDEKTFWSQFIKHEMARRVRPCASARAKHAASGQRQGRWCRFYVRGQYAWVWIRSSAVAEGATANTCMRRQSVQARQREARAAGTASGAGAADEEDPYAEFRDAGEVQREARRMVSSVDPTVNLAADRYDGFSAQGEARAAATRVRAATPPAPVCAMRKRERAPDSRAMPQGAEGMFQDINRHAAVVLQGVPAGQAARGPPAVAGPATRPEDLRERAESALDDLRQPTAESFMALHISDPRRYFDSGARADAHSEPCAAASAPAPQRLSAALQALEGARLRNPPVDPAAARRVLADINGQHWGGGGAGGWDAGAGWSAGAPAEQIVPQMQGLLRSTVLTCNELLRHFWASFPLTSAAREQRVQRIRTALCEQYDRTTAMQESAHGLERVHITQVLKPLRQALDAALAKLEQPAAAALVH